jgi:hypothetical protein
MDDEAGEGTNEGSGPGTDTALEMHYGVTCDSCGQSPIVGRRHKCSACPDFDLCERCKAQNDSSNGQIHDSSHTFSAVAAPVQTGANAGAAPFTPVPVNRHVPSAPSATAAQVPQVCMCVCEFCMCI